LEAVCMIKGCTVKIMIYALYPHKKARYC